MPSLVFPERAVEWDETYGEWRCDLEDGITTIVAPTLSKMQDDLDWNDYVMGSAADDRRGSRASS